MVRAETQTPLRGVLAVPVTPFRSDGTVDERDLARQVEFCIAAGAHGLVYPAVVSEFFTLSESERRRGVQIVHAAASNAVPVVAGVAAPSSLIAASFARHASEIGCDAVMAMPPYVAHFFPMVASDVVAYYRHIADASGLPIVAQNARIGPSLSLSDLVALVDDVPEVSWLKQEVGVCTHSVSAAIGALGDRIDGVFSGLGGIYLVNELDRGAVGTMPAPPFLDVIAAAFNDYAAGQRDASIDRLEPLGSVFTYELLYNIELIKTVLVRRGIITSATTRVPVPGMDRVDIRLLDEVLRRLALPALIPR